MPDSATPEPGKKYWWAVGIIVPLTVALIGLVGQLLKSDGMAQFPRSTTPRENTLRVRPPSESPSLNVSGTTWEGTIKVTNESPFQMVFNTDGTALAENGPRSSDGSKVLRHCTWAPSGGIIRAECAYETVGVNCPDPPCTTKRFRVPEVYVFRGDASSLTGTREDGYLPTATVTLKRRN
jgi:hypothetical protein